MSKSTDPAAPLVTRGDKVPLSTRSDAAPRLATSARDRKDALSEYEQWVGDVIDALKTPLVQGLLELDLGPIYALRANRPKVSDVAFIVAATGRVLAKDPTVHTIIKRRHRIVPAAPEIGVSVASRGALAPVTIIRDSHLKDARTIHREIIGGAKRARRLERETMRQARRMRFLPGFLRRMLIRWTLASPGVRRKLVGTFQISSLQAYDIEAAMTPIAAAPLLMLGRCRERVVVRDGKIEIRPTVWAVIHADHRVLNGATASAFKLELQALLNQPEALLDSVAGAASDAHASESVNEA